MALEPEIQRIIPRDGPTVLCYPLQWPSQNPCIRSMSESLQNLLDKDMITEVDPEAMTSLINDATQYMPQWIAS